MEEQRAEVSCLDTDVQHHKVERNWQTIELKVDSGVAASVAPKGMAPCVELRESARSKWRSSDMTEALDVNGRQGQCTVRENSLCDLASPAVVNPWAAQVFKLTHQVQKLRLEKKVGEHIVSSHLVVSWMTEHAVDMLIRYTIGEDSRTTYARLKGRTFGGGGMLEFGNVVMFRGSGKVHGGSMQER